ncbi:hypothetical protein JHK85_045756 [Glycine max]|nr:hypothetical protein JHK85_045756 [Glycine max]
MQRLIDYREGIAAPDTHCPHVLNSSLIPNESREGNAVTVTLSIVSHLLCPKR